MVAAAAAVVVVAGTTVALTTRTVPAGDTAVHAMSWPVPDDTLTPGWIVVGCTYPVTADRAVDDALRRRVRDEYHYIGPTDLASVEIDHRVPHALCGADDIRNLWPEPADGVTQSGFTHNRKDDLERVIAGNVRFGKMSLQAAQQVFLGDWRVGWCAALDSPTDGVTCP